MTRPKLIWLAVPALLAGCLEVDQHAPWKKGQYAGKRDQLPYEVHYQRDRMAWWATLSNRNLRQNEYNRAKPPAPQVAGLPPQFQPPAPMPPQGRTVTGLPQQPGATPQQPQAPGQQFQQVQRIQQMQQTQQSEPVQPGAQARRDRRAQ